YSVGATAEQVGANARAFIAALG
ncbi:MAG: 2-dehydro-3-deoxy-6-phosphogalactonate aldolase, partial [Sphingomonas sp.]